MKTPKMFRYSGPMALGLLLALAGCGDDDDNSQTNQNDAAVAPQDAAVDAAPDAGLTLPDSPAAERLQWLVDAINDGTLNQTTYEESFSPQLRSGIPYSVFAGEMLEYIQTWAPLTITGYHEGSASAHSITGYVHGEGSDLWMYLLVAVDATAPHPIRMHFEQPTPDLDPDYGPPAADEVDIYAEHWSTFGDLTDHTVELVDAATGDSFDPPATGAVDMTYLHARIGWPAGATEVGLRITEPGGVSSTVYGMPVEPGRPGLDPVVWMAPTNILDAWASQAGVTADATRAHVFAFVRYTWPNPFDLFLEPRHVEDVMVGCATVSAAPPLTDLFYVEENAISDTATQTSPDNSIFLAFNLDPVGHVFTLDAGGELRQMTVPPLTAGELTFLWMIFDTDTWTSNPTPAGCGAP